MTDREIDPVISYDFTLSYSLTGSGWAECTVSAGGVLAQTSASYLSDALGQLATATLMLRLGAPSARVSFDEEPGEYRWGFDWHTSPNGDTASIRVRIWWFDELWGRRPDDQGELRFDRVIDTKVFYRGVRTMLDDVLRRYGEERYNRQWDRYTYPKGVRQDLYKLLDEWPGK